MSKSILFLLVMIESARVQNVQPPPVPGDCTVSPYAGGGGRLYLDCTLSAINSEYEATNFSVIPGEHTAGLTVRCSDTLAASHLEPQGNTHTHIHTHTHTHTLV